LTSFLIDTIVLIYVSPNIEKRPAADRLKAAS
jgi:hypothetical protein